MFESMNFFQLISKGGYTILFLMVCSVITVAVSIEKYLSLKKMKAMSENEIDRLKSAVTSSDIKAASEISRKSGTLLGEVVMEGLKYKEQGAIKEAVLREISHKIFNLEKYLSSVGTIGAISPFIGLLGTVIGIMRAFHDLGKYGVGNPSIVSSGIAEALVATAAGLMVAIPSVILYNYFSRRINRLFVQTENDALEILNPLIYADKR